MGFSTGDLSSTLPEEKWPGYLHSYEGDGMEEQRCPLMASSLQFFPSAG